MDKKHLAVSAQAHSEFEIEKIKERSRRSSVLTQDDFLLILLQSHRKITEIREGES